MFAMMILKSLLNALLQSIVWLIDSRLLTRDIQEIKEIRASSNGTIPKWIKTQLHLEKSLQ